MRNSDVNNMTGSVNENKDELNDQLERSFIWQFNKYLSSDVIIFPHYEIDTTDETFLINFLIKTNNKRILIEFQTRVSNDEKERNWKDSQIIKTNQIDTIYRFIGNDILPFVVDCIYFISQFDKDIFNHYYPHFNRVLKYEEKARTFISYNMVGVDDIFVYKQQLTIDLINRKTCQHLFELIEP